MDKLPRIVGLLISYAVIIIITIIASALVVSAITDPASKAAIIVGEITLVGSIFTAIFGEISSYYRDKRLVLEKKWDLVFPFIKEHYNPWLNSAKSLKETLKTLEGDTSITIMTRLLFLIMVFYSYRLQFILKEGSVLLFMTSEEDKKADEAYRKLRSSLDWAGIETPIRVSQLQSLFITKSKPDDPYVQYKFEQDIQGNSYLKESREKLTSWIQSQEKLKEVDTNLAQFIETYQNSIAKLYTILNV